MRVLVVDDERQDLKSVSITLKSRGFKVLETLSALEALEQMKRAPEIDLVLTDYSMPEMDGLELLRRIRQEFGQIPVIIMTAYADKDLVIQAFRYKCNGFLEKPFDSQELFSAIEIALLEVNHKINLCQRSRAIPKVIHQINNPLMAITGSAELGLLEADNSETVRRSFERILEATKKLNEIGKSLLQTGTHTTKAEHLEGVSIHKVLTECIESFSGLLGLKGIEVRKEFTDSEAMVVGNRFDLEQVFKNLLLNSMDALDNMEDKHITVRTELQSGDRLSVYIMDSGSGIPEHMFDSIFDPTTTTKKTGNGLGLVVVKEIIERINGEITFKSKVGEGTVFRINLPILNDHNKRGQEEGCRLC